MWFVQIVQTLAWPLVVVWITWWFSTEIRNLAALFERKTVKVEGYGFKASVEIAEQVQEASSPVNDKLAQVAALGPNTRDASAVIETDIGSALAKIDSASRESVLQRSLADTRLMAAHEFIYNRIFGSQIIALRTLNERSSCTVAEAREFWQNFAQQFPEMYPAYSFEQWLDFLVRNGLVNRQGHLLNVSVFGRDFLIYLAESSLSEHKMF